MRFCGGQRGTPTFFYKSIIPKGLWAHGIRKSIIQKEITRIYKSNIPKEMLGAVCKSIIPNGLFCDIAQEYHFMRLSVGGVPGGPQAGRPNGWSEIGLSDRRIETRVAA